jgi:hypothetical protein
MMIEEGVVDVVEAFGDFSDHPSHDVSVDAEGVGFDHFLEEWRCF